MRYFSKGENNGFFGKGGLGSKFLSGARGVASALDTPLAETIVMALNPELGVGLKAARSSGLLERIKN